MKTNAVLVLAITVGSLVLAGCDNKAATSAPLTARAVDPADRAELLDEATVKRIKAMTVTLPAFPAADGKLCGGGTFTFRDGKAATQPGRSDVPQYFVLFKGLKGIKMSNDMFVVPMGCGHIEVLHRLLVLKQAADGSFTALGYIPDDHFFDRFYVDNGELVIEVLSGPGEGQEKRWRFRWDGQVMQSAAGNEPFAQPYDPASGDLRHASFSIGGGQGKDPCGASGVLSFADGASGVWEYQEEGMTIKPASFWIDNAVYGLLDEPAPGKTRRDALVTLSCKGATGVTEQWVYGVSYDRATPIGRMTDRITSTEISDGVAVVKTETSTKRYRFNGLVFAELS